MAQYIKQGNIFGRIGTGIGKGLGEQLPKEIERGRLASGLEQLGKQEGMTPFQQFTGLASVPGITPQMIESGANLLRQQGMLQGARGRPNKSEEQFNAIRTGKTQTPNDQGIGLVGQQNTQAALQPAIPKSLAELQDRAVQLHEESPGLYPDYQTALAGAETEDKQRIAQNAAQQNARQTQKGVESDIRNELQNLKQNAKVQIPDNEYQKIENKAIEEIANGKNELTAAKDARDELDRISRDYSKIDSFGDYTLLGSNPKDVRNSIDSLRKKFSERNQSENLADALVGRVGLSNEYAHYLAMPPRPQVAKFIEAGVDMKSEPLIKKLAAMLNKDDSPLAIAHLLSENEKDANLWRKYLIQNQDELNLSKRQIRELEKIDKIAQGFLNDIWLEVFGGP